MTVHHHMAAVLGRVVYLGKLRACTLTMFVHGAPKARTRASAVAAAVAEAMGIEDSPWFRADLKMALLACGWRCVRVGNVPWWKGVAAK